MNPQENNETPDKNPAQEDALPNTAPIEASSPIEEMPLASDTTQMTGSS